MATYDDLKLLSENMFMIKGRELFNQYECRFDKVGEHVPRPLADANNEFVRLNRGLVGVLNFDEYGFTEPEEERDCLSNNFALCHLDELMPFLEKMNEQLSEEDLQSPNYSLRVLHLAAEIYQAKMDDLSEDKMNYLCTESFAKDYKFFGCKHYEYNMCDARRRFEKGFSIDDVRRYQDMDLQYRQILDFYCDLCESRGVKPTESMEHLLSNAVSPDECYELYTAYQSGVSEDNLQLIHKEVTNILDCLKHPNECPFDVNLDKLSASRVPGYVQDCVSIISKLEQYDFDTDVISMNNCLPIVVRKFVESKDDSIWISDYFDKHADRLIAYMKDIGNLPSRWSCSADESRIINDSYSDLIDGIDTEKECRE